VRALALIVILCASKAFAVPTDLQAFDVAQCLRWSMTSNTGGAQAEAFKTASRLEQKQPNSATLRERQAGSLHQADELAWVFSANAIGSGGRRIQKFGVCSYQTTAKQSQFYCLPDQDFPFAGSTYRQTNSNEALKTLTCISGCNSAVPTAIYDISGLSERRSKGWTALDRLSKKFRQKCGEV